VIGADGRVGSPLAGRRVTVVIPTKDRPEYVARCLSEVLSQVDVDLDVVIVDDGSELPLRCDRRLQPRLRDERVRVIRHDRSRGVAAARNSGIEVATAPWVAFVDDDDLWAPSKLALQLEALGRQPGALWSYTGEILLRGDLSVLRVPRVPDPTTVPELLTRFNAVPGGGSSVVAAAGVLRELGGFDEGFAILADWDLWLRLGDRSLPVAVDRPLVGYVRHAAGMSVDTTRSRREFKRLEQKHANREGLSGNHHFDHLLYHLYLAELEFTVGRRMRSLGIYSRAAVERPGRSLRLAIRRLGRGWSDRFASGRDLTRPRSRLDAEVQALVKHWRSVAGPTGQLPPPEGAEEDRASSF